VLVFEPAGEPRGSLKTSRKGVGEIELRVTGRAAHSGLKPEEGINAVHELALQIAKIAKWNQPRRGIGVHVNVASGGTRGNVIAAEAHAMIDVRVTRASASGNPRRILAPAHGTQNDRRSLQACE
jgi:glutamate carboxypeptidase